MALVPDIINTLGSKCRFITNVACKCIFIPMYQYKYSYVCMYIIHMPPYIV